MHLKKLCAGLVALLAVGLMSAAVAHEQGAHLARMWEIMPKADSREAFSKAFKEHMAWRKDNKDPWGWSVFSATTGKGVNSTFVRSTGHHWEDFDAYRDSEFSKKAGEHWNANVHPHVAKYDSSIDKSDSELFYWPEGNYRYFFVTTFYLKPGHGGAARQAVVAVTDELNAAGRKSPHVWLWDTTGKHLPAFSVVTAREDWAGFDWPEKSVRDTMVERVGEEKAQAMFDDFFEHVKSQESQIYAKDMELSFEAAE